MTALSDRRAAWWVVKVGPERGGGLVGRSVSPGRFPNPAAAFQRTGLSTGPVGVRVSPHPVLGQGVGIAAPR